MRTSRARARLLEDVLVPFGCALAAGALVATLVPPHWTAPGLPFFVAYAKNVEVAAVAAAVAAAVGATLLGPRRPLCLVTAAGGVALLAARGHLRVLAAAWLPIGLALLVPLLLDATGHDLTDDRPAANDVPRSPTAAALLALAALAFVLGSEPLVLDVFHHGEVLASAVDLLHGGRPFKSFIWPHGVHDTGLAALWIAVGGKIGTSPVALARATCRALGVVAGYALARRVLGRRSSALGVAAMLALLPIHGTLPKPAECPDVLYQLGVLAFVILAYAALTARVRGGTLLAGALLGCGYLFRIETALYGAVASVALLACRTRGEGGGASAGGAASAGRRAIAARELASECAALALGVAAALVASRLVLGWPDGAWFDYSLRELPRHHRDAVGIPFPWPLRGELASSALPHRGAALGWLAFVPALAVQVARSMATRGRVHGTLVFVAAFALLATRSSLDRSDAGHFLQWAALPLVTVALLLVRRARAAGWPTSARAALLVLALLWIDGPAVRGAPLLASPATVLATAAERWRATAEHLAANPPAGPCDDTTMTPLETRRPANARFLVAACDLERLLRAHGVRALVVAHSAPWYHVRLGMAPPSRFFAFARAYGPAAQLALVDDLRAAQPSALLRARGFEALEIFDVADAVRVPVVDAYLRARTGGVRAHATPLGDVYFWNEPAGAATPDVVPRVPSDEAVDYPDAGSRLVFGRATGDGERFPAVAAANASAAGVWVGIDGSSVRLTGPPERTRTLPHLTGDEWRGLPAAIERARSLGIADRRQHETSSPEH